MPGFGLGRFEILKCLSLPTTQKVTAMAKIIMINRSIAHVIFRAIHSADEKHLSPDTNVVGIVKYLITNFG